MFKWWESDPDGYLRHLMVGAVLALLLSKSDWKVSVTIILIVAIGKEVSDQLSGKFFSLMDIFFTLSPYIYGVVFRKQWKYSSLH